MRHRALLSDLARLAYETIEQLLCEAAGDENAPPGVVCVPQTFGSLLQPHPTRTDFPILEGSCAAVFTFADAGAGPVVVVWLSLIAIDRAPVGIASTLMSLTPIVLLPIARIVFSEPISYRAVVGTVAATSGAAILIG